MNKAWTWRPLGELFEIGTGKTMSAAARRGTDKTPFLRTSNVLWGEVDISSVDEMSIPNHELPAKLLMPGDLLVCEGGEIGRAAIWDGEVEPMSFQNHLHRLRPIAPDVEPRFYVFFLQCAFTQLRIFEGEANKTTIPNLSRSRLAALDVPQPPLGEQQAIVAALSRIRGTLKVQSQAIAVTLELKHTALHILFRRGLRGEPLKETAIGQVPENWQVETIGKLTTVVYRYPTYYGINYVEHGVPEVRGELLRNDGVIETDFSLFRFIDPETASRFPKVQLDAGDIVMSVRGTLGKVGMAQEIHVGSVITANLIRLAPNRHRILPQFFKAVLVSKRFSNALEMASSQTTIKTITAPVLKSLRLPLPPTLYEQREIIAVLDAIDRKIDLHRRKRFVSEELFKALLHKLMTGAIRVEELAPEMHLYDIEPVTQHEVDNNEDLL